jgi:cyclopropane-fatty-acyl-phospholipid synthase
MTLGVIAAHPLAGAAAVAQARALLQQARAAAGLHHAPAAAPLHDAATPSPHHDAPPPHDHQPSPPPLPAPAPAAARAVFRLLQQLRVGTLDVQLPDGSQVHFGTPARRAARGMRLLDWSVCSAALKSGDIGFAESYIAGHWSSPDLVALLKLFIANRDAIEGVIYGTWWGSLLLPRCKHLLNRNSRRGSRKNIHAHYDIGNPFYRLWLDETMNYSSALFDGDLHAARWPRRRRQGAPRAARVRRAARPALLEIGCGWGALAEMRGARVRRAGHRRHAVHRAAGLRPGALAGRPGRARRPAPAGLPRHRRRPFDAIARSRCSRPWAASTGPATSPRCAASSSRAAAPASRPSPSATTCSSATCVAPTSSSSTSSPAACCPAAAPSAPRPKAGLEVVNELRLRPDYAETLRRWRVQLPGARHAGAAAGLRHPLHAHLGVLPGLLRGGLCHRQHRRRAVHAAPAGGLTRCDEPTRSGDPPRVPGRAWRPLLACALAAARAARAGARRPPRWPPSGAALPGAAAGAAAAALPRPARLRRPAVGAGRPPPTGPRAAGAGAASTRALQGPLIAERSLKEMRARARSRSRPTQASAGWRR